MTATIIGSLVRAVLASVGGAGLISNDQISQLSGAVALTASVAWSVWQKYQAQQAMAKVKDEQGAGS